jgi:hypothetical protein
MAKELEFRTISGPGEVRSLLEGLEAQIRAMTDPETKYKFQVKLRDVDFGVDEEKAKALGVTLPVGSIEEAERRLREGVITPREFIELDETIHQVLEFDPTPVGYSGFADCVIHSLARTGRGLFEVGRYPAMNLKSGTKTWQWFIHRRIETHQSK